MVFPDVVYLVTEGFNLFVRRKAAVDVDVIVAVFVYDRCSADCIWKLDFPNYQYVQLFSSYRRIV